MAETEPHTENVENGESGDGAAPLFSVVLSPNRSLSKPGFIAFMLVLSLASFSAGMIFLLHGAWPVFGFFGLDVALVWLAFKLNYRSGRARETVDLFADRLVVRRMAANGRTQEWSFQPYWVRIEIEERDDMVGPLMLRSHGRSLALAAFLSGPERLDFARALACALNRVARQGAPA